MNRRSILIAFLVVLTLFLLFSWQSYTNFAGETWRDDHSLANDKAETKAEVEQEVITCAPNTATVTETAEKALTTYTRIVNATEFVKFAAQDEQYPSELLSQSELDLVNSALKIALESPREKRLKRFYDLNGAQDWTNYINSLDDDVSLQSFSPLTPRFFLEPPPNYHNVANI